MAAPKTRSLNEKSDFFPSDLYSLPSKWDKHSTQVFHERMHACMNEWMNEWTNEREWGMKNHLVAKKDHWELKGTKNTPLMGWGKIFSWIFHTEWVTIYINKQDERGGMGLDY